MRMITTLLSAWRNANSRILDIHPQGYSPRRTLPLHSHLDARREPSRRSIRLPILEEPRRFRFQGRCRDSSRYLAFRHLGHVCHCGSRFHFHGCRRNGQPSTGHSQGLQDDHLPYSRYLRVQCSRREFQYRGQGHTLMTGRDQCPIQRRPVTRCDRCRSARSCKVTIRHQHEPTRYPSPARLGQRHCPHFRLFHRFFFPLRLEPKSVQSGSGRSSAKNRDQDDETGCPIRCGRVHSPHVVSVLPRCRKGFRKG